MQVNQCEVLHRVEARVRHDAPLAGGNQGIPHRPRVQPTPKLRRASQFRAICWGRTCPGLAHQISTM